MTSSSTSLSAVKFMHTIAFLSPFLLMDPVIAEIQSDTPSDAPVYELEELEVLHSESKFAPYFRTEQPRFSYYEVPEVPKGDLLVALDFMDRYRATSIPGKMKWAAILSFPVIDGYGTEHLKLICLYLYNDRMFGFDSSAEREVDRRFAVPIQYEDRLDPDLHFKFAFSFVDRVYPEREEEVWFEEVGDSDDPSSTAEGYYEVLSIPAGRIAPIRASQKGKQGSELVRLMFRYSVPNPDAENVAVEMGTGEDYGIIDRSWERILEDLRGPPDAITLAAQLVAPRWSGVFRLHYKKSLRGVFEWEARRRILIFNINSALYAYDPELGIWKTEAQLGDIKDPDGLLHKLNHPWFKMISRLEYVPGDLSNSDTK